MCYWSVTQKQKQWVNYKKRLILYKPFAKKKVFEIGEKNIRILTKTKNPKFVHVRQKNFFFEKWELFCHFLNGMDEGF